MFVNFCKYPCYFFSYFIGGNDTQDNFYIVNVAIIASVE